MAKKKVVRMKAWEGFVVLLESGYHTFACENRETVNRWRGANGGGRIARVRITEIVPKKKPAKGRRGAKKR